MSEQDYLIDASATRTEAAVRVAGDRRVRDVPAALIRREERIKFYAFPLTVGGGPPGSWHKSDGDAVIVCPRCGERSTVHFDPSPSLGYTIKANGLLYPSWLCPQTFCDLDHFVLLQGWNGMGALGRKRDNERGVIFYACIPLDRRGHIAPTEYTHATSRDEAIAQFAPLMRANGWTIFEVAPAIDPHVAGADPGKSVHLWGG